MITKNTNKDNFITVRELYINKKEEFNLTLIAGHKGMDNPVTEITPYRPGLALTGYTDYFRHDAVQIIGKTETAYLESISQKRRSRYLKNMFSFRIPVIFVCRDIDPSRMIKILANKYDIPIIKTDMETTVFHHSLTVYLNTLLAPSTTVHGTLVDIYGVGVLLTGLSGIGKSEAALDLIDRGHRLVADDAVKIFKRGEHLLMGTGIAPDSALQYHMEVRGIGILDIAKMYGIRGVRLHKRVELQVNLVKWSPDIDLERTGIKEDNIDILDVEIPLVKVPLVPGKNISVIIEVISLNHILKLSGYDTAKIFNATLISLMQDRAKKLARLDEDEE